MSDRAARRFWSEVRVEARHDGYAIRLDDRIVKTPVKHDLVVPTEPMAAAVAAEWEAQEDVIDPATMPATRAVNAALDRVAPQRTAVADMLVEYGATDLLCYRAASPEGLAQRQSERWDPLLDWAAETLGARLVPVAGLMPAAQAEAAMEALSGRVHAMDPFRLTAFHDLVTLSGSLVLAFAVIHDRLDAPCAWEVSRVDEEWQAERWGQDAEADATAAARRGAFLAAARFHLLAMGAD